MANVLIVGESWVSQAHHVEGWDSFGSATCHTGHQDLQAALVADGRTVTHMPSHATAASFPLELAALRAFVAWEGYAQLWTRLVRYLAAGALEEARA